MVFLLFIRKNSYFSKYYDEGNFVKKIKEIIHIMNKVKMIMIIKEYQMHYVEEHDIKIQIIDGKENVLFQ